MAQTASNVSTEAENDAAMEKKAQKALFRSQVMSGTTPIQLKAKAIRSKVILSNAAGTGGGKKLFKETNFQYLGDTVVLWNLEEYLDHPKWKEDALRRSLKRRQREASLAMASSSSSSSKMTAASVSLPAGANNNGNGLKSKSRKKRFYAVVEALYQKSLEEENTTDTATCSPERKRLKS